MSETEHDQGGIEDEDLPEDLQPTDDNPLAQEPDDVPDDLDVLAGKDPEGDPEE